MGKNISVTKLSASEAKKFFLQEECYCNIDLPKYFSFKKILSEVEKTLGDENLSDFYKKKQKPKKFEGVNYTLFYNKNGQYGWRPLQLIHPVIYVYLVNQITDRSNWKSITDTFKTFQDNERIKGVSIPVRKQKKDKSNKATMISHWWQEFEQQSIELGLEYEYMFQTDISNFYASIYTHSIPWALHGKEQCKQRNNSDKNLIGNIIDAQLRNMSYGQTNGIPQGSVLMDFIAEILLGYADNLLSGKIKKIADYKILRYRDDYRIFVNTPQDGEEILKLLTELLIDLGLQLNPHKTSFTEDIISNSIKPDKLFWLCNKREHSDPQKKLMTLHQLAKKYPDSGRLPRELNEFYSTIYKKKTIQNIQVLISIVANIALTSPRTYPIVAAILSKLICLMIPKEQKEIIQKLENKLSKIPNTGHLDIWLQRITYKIDPKKMYKERLCFLLESKSETNIWNSEWLDDKFQDLISNTKIIDPTVLKDMPPKISPEEVELFQNTYSSS